MRRRHHLEVSLKLQASYFLRSGSIMGSGLFLYRARSANIEK